MKKIMALLLAFIMIFSVCGFADSSAPDISLKLKYKMGGQDSLYYIPEAYYVSPVVCDLNKDGKSEIVMGNYSLSVLDGITGNILWKVNGGKDRQSPYVTGQDIGILWDLEVKDIDKDGNPEIIASHANGTVSVLDNNGYFKPGWPKKLMGENGYVNDFARSLAVDDINNDGYLEIAVGASTRAAENLFVYDYKGNMIKGFPQLASNQDATITYDKLSGYSYGVFMDGVSIGDIDGDGYKDIIVPTDTAYICAYDRFGKLIEADRNLFQGRRWGKIAMWDSYDTEKNMNFNEGWGWPEKGNETRAELYKGELGHAVTKVMDVDNNGSNEVLTSAVIVDRFKDVNSNGDYMSSRYMDLYIFNGDRTRYPSFIRTPGNRGIMGRAVINDPATLSCSVQAEPVVADLDNDGINEVIINTYDGCVHAFSVNDTSSESGAFPYKIPCDFSIAETATGVVAKDITGDGKAELIFATNTENSAHDKVTGALGRLSILNYKGFLYKDIKLPESYPVYETKLPAYTNRALAKPVVCDIDNDNEYEVIINTRYGGICVYDIIGSTVRTYAEPTKATLLVNGKKVDSTSYSINGYNYFKLRDVATLVNNTDKNFAVSYNENENSVVINKKKPYVKVGGELKKNDGLSKWAVKSDSKIMNGNALATYIPYMIDGNNYFKLRDICHMANIEVSWDEEEQTISINSL